MSSMSSVRSRRLSIPAAGAGILLFFVFTWPLVYLFSDGFKTPDGRFTLAYLVQLLGDPSFYRVIANTIIVNTGGTLLAFCSHFSLLIRTCLASR